MRLSAPSHAVTAKARKAVREARNAGPDRSWTTPVAAIKRVRLIEGRWYFAEREVIVDWSETRTLSS
jgi:hypothetical protein